MVRTIEYFLIAGLVVGVIATPGIGAIVLLLLPLLGLGFIWRSAVTVATRGQPSEAVIYTRRSHLLGPGGPDDSFAGGRRDEGAYAAVASSSSRATSVSARNGIVRGAKVRRPDLAGLRSASTPTIRSEI
jgi:hypothetical protein